MESQERREHGEKRHVRVRYGSHVRLSQLNISFILKLHTSNTLFPSVTQFTVRSGFENGVTHSMPPPTANTLSVRLPPHGYCGSIKRIALVAHCRNQYFQKKKKNSPLADAQLASHILESIVCQCSRVQHDNPQNCGAVLFNTLFPCPEELPE